MTTSAQSGGAANYILVVQINDWDIRVGFRIVAGGFADEDLYLLRRFEEFGVDLERLPEPAFEPHAQPDEAAVADPRIALEMKAAWEQRGE